jgi:hypothetical protein
MAEPTLEDLRARAQKQGVLICEIAAGYRVYSADSASFDMQPAHEVLTLGELDAYIAGMEHADEGVTENAQLEYPFGGAHGPVRD